MIVALENGLEKFHNILLERGHQVVPLYGHGGGVDAIIYQNETIFELPLSPQNYSGEEGGIFMVCARGLEPEQLAEILEHRAYGGKGLFEL